MLLIAPGTFRRIKLSGKLKNPGFGHRKTTETWISESGVHNI